MTRFRTLAHWLMLLVVALAGCGPALSTAAPTPRVITVFVTPTPQVAVEAAAPAAPAAPEAPRVTRRLPVESSLTQRRPEIRLIFSEPMDALSVAAALSVEPATPLDLAWEGNTLVVTPGEPLTPGQAYAFVLSTTARSAAGLPLAKAYDFTYHIKPVLERTQLPTLSEPGRAIVLYFNYPLDPDSARTAFHIEPEVKGELALHRGQQLWFTPTVALATYTTYTVSFKGTLLTTGGEALPLPEPITFTSPPPILALHPKPGSSQATATPIRITFDRPMDQAATEAAITIEPAVEFEAEWAETTLSLTPAQGYFDEETQYRVTVGSGAVDAAGAVVFPQPFTWTFSTGRHRRLATFGIGPNAQVVDADGRRALQYVYENAAVSAEFELYRLTPEQFLDQYASGFGGDFWQPRPDLDVTGLPRVAVWTDAGLNAVNTAFGQRAAETVIPAEVPPGLYILNMRTGSLSDQLLLVLSRHVVTVKQAEGQLVAWVTDAAGNAAPGVRVGVYARTGEVVAQGVTDANGLFRTAVARDPQPLIVLAQAGDDVSASGLSSEWRSGLRGWYGWWRPTPQTPNFAVYIYTDRPIYQPGQTVYFKGMVRRDDDAVLSLPPAGTPVTVRLRDGRNNVVQTLELATSDFGTFHGEFAVAEGAMLGNYAVEVTVDGEAHRQVLKVQDYRKPDYAVTVTTDAARYVAGDTIQVAINARYFFDQPVANARVTLKQYGLTEAYCYDQCPAAPQYTWYETGRQVASRFTGPDGTVSFSLRAQPGPEHTEWSRDPARLGLEVTVDDGSRQVVSAFTVVEVYPAAERLSLDTGGLLHAPGEPFTVQVSAAGLEGQPVTGRRLTVEVLRWSSYQGDFADVVHSAVAITSADGKGQASLTVPEAGYYKVRLAGHDAQGNTAEAFGWIYVFAAGSLWEARANTELRVSAAEMTYAPGQVAELLVESTFSGPALLTVERGTTRREQLVTLTAPLTRLPLLILPDDAPNLFASVAAWQPQPRTLDAYADPDLYLYETLPDAILRTATVALTVPVTGKSLNVTLTPDRPTYAPRETATFSVRVTNSRGEPVSAEVALALVDEAIFSLSDDLAGPIFDGFYFSRPHSVRTYDSLALRRWLIGMEAGGGGGGPDLADPRQNFPDTAAWAPALRTDANGEATLTVALPDTLTTWRLTAKAITADTQVGEAHITVVTQQPISVRPLLPRGLTAGDQAVLSAVVRNDTDGRRSLLVALEAAGLRLTGPATHTLSLAPGEQRLVGWSVIAESPGEAAVTVRAMVTDAGLPGAGDAVRLPLTVQPLAIADLSTQVGDFGGAFETTVSLPAGALPMSSVRLELSRSIAGTLLTGLEYLTGFPYGCVEQTMSKALPNAVVGRALRELGVTNPTLMADLPAQINASVQRLYGFQHNDGGWGWWFDDETDDYQTAWVVFGLALTAQAGYEVDSGVIRRGAEYLLSGLEAMDPPTRAFALYALSVAGYGDLEAARDLAREASTLDPFSQAGLALALHRLGAASEARAVLAHLASTAKARGQDVYWDTGLDDGNYHRKTMASDVRSTALALSAFVNIYPNHPLEPGIVRWLMSRRGAAGWGTTNETSFAVLALTDHLRAQQAATALTGYTVEVNGRVWASGELGPGEPAVTLEIPAADLQAGDNTLRFTQNGPGRLFYVVNSRVYLAQASLDAAGRLSVVREYTDVETGRPLVGPARPGQLVQVRLRVRTAEPAMYVVVEDRLPGGLEPLNESLNTASHDAAVPMWATSPYRWQVLGYNYKEVRGDRVSFFITQLDAGTHTYTYLARATRSGTYTALPAEAWAMYNLALWGRSASRVFEVAPD